MFFIRFVGVLFMKNIFMSLVAIFATFGLITAEHMAASKATSTDLFRAVKTGNDKMLRLMLKHRHNLEIRNEAGNTLLVEAVLMGNRKAVKKILAYGVSVNALTADNKTALDLAVEYGYSKIAFDLVKHGGKVTNQDNLYYLKTMLKDRSFSLLLQFPILWIFGGILCAVLIIPLLAIEACVPVLGGCLVAAGILGYVGYTVSLPFRAYSWHSSAEHSWLMHIA